MKQGIGGVLAAVAGALGAWAIVNVVDLGSCIGACEEQLAVVPFLIGATVLLLVAAFLSRWAMVIAPVVGLVTAGVLLVADGADIGANLGMAGFIAFSVLLGPAIVVAIAIRSRAKQKVAANLVATGQRAVAHIQSVRETGVFINNRPQVEVSYVIHPLSGAPAFPHTKRQTLSFGAPPPRPGLAWPAWYDPADPQTVAVGAPSGAGLDPASQAQFAEFGLSPTQVYGYDPTAGAQGFGGPSSPAGTWG